SGVLLSGDPGIGKSTLLMQICGILAEKYKILYVSGEESSKQLRLRSQRLNVNSDNISIMIETDVENISSYIYGEKPDIVMVDSIQTMSYAELNSSPGSITQVRECTNILLRAGKSMDIPIIIVGHVNKDGAIAGPKVMEHIVDAVLYFEGERNYSYRILRAIKNRYGSTNEIGVFEMTDEGLKEVHSPSVALLSGRLNGVSGNCIACVIEGSRPILAEVQALVASTSFGNPRRMATGFDYNRVNMLLAVLEKRLGLLYSNLDAYLNIIGGLKLDEPASDLAVALALVSSLKDKPLPSDLVAFGEIGLAGEIRSVPRILSRINEISRLGFNKCVIPYYNFKQIKDKVPQNVELIGVKSISEAVRYFF
ncbi:MAG: DNA repair protein RadA, partial [bacterium]|nr:DNA repair protein RadA [bacterium]